MKVCLISGSYPPVRCGVGDYTECLAAGLAKAGIQVTVLTSAGIALQPDSKVKVLTAISSWKLKGLISITKALKKIRPEIVHLQYPSIGYGRGLAVNLLFGWMRALRFGMKRVITLHEYGTYTMAGRWRLGPTLISSQRIICTNQQDLNAVKQFHPGCGDRLEIIPLASSVGSLANSKVGSATAYQLPDPTRTWLLHFGTIMPNKGWETLLPALKMLLHEGRKIGLLVAGELQPGKYAYHQKIQNQIRDLQLESALHFTGYFSQTQAAAILTACPIAIQPYSEGLSLQRSSFVALLAYGRAIVTTDPLYLLETVRHGQSFWGVIPHDPKALAEGIKYLLDHPEVVARLMAGARRAADYFRWERVINLHRSLYQMEINR